MQETGRSPDPQRQYARLLGVAARGEKILRRLAHLRAASPVALAEARRWLRLERRLMERGVPCLLMWPGEPLLLVDVGSPPLAVVRKASCLPASALGAAVGMAFDDEPVAWAVGPDGWVRWSLAARMGARTWGALARATRRAQKAETAVAVARRDDEALTVLAALGSAGQALWEVPPALWLPAAQLWRHRGVPQRLGDGVGEALGQAWPWLQRVGGAWLWPAPSPSQDEDIVRSAGWPTSGRAPGGRGVDV